MKNIQRNVLLASYTTFKIGGLAEYFAEAESIEEVQEFCNWAKNKNLPVFVLGGGSNVLVSDKGFGGLVIRFKNLKFKIKNSEIYASAGLPLSVLVSEAVKAGLAGLEWAIGIPGTIGGAVCGNTEAFGKDVSNCIHSVKVLDCASGSILDFNKKQCDFYYRGSFFSTNSNFIILGAEFILEKESSEIIQKKIKENIKQRIMSFKSNYNCAGCFFKNIEWKRKGINKDSLLKKFPELKQFTDKSKISVGFLIDHMGMKNKKIGDAVIFNDHAGFILNLGNAKAEHVIMLASMIKQRIYNKYSFSLEEEVRLVGF